MGNPGLHRPQRSPALSRVLVASFAVLAVGSSLACGSSDSAGSGRSATEVTQPTATSSDTSELYAACKKEGRVNLISVPEDWANYRGVLATFHKKYPGIETPIQSPFASSAEERQAVIDKKGKADQPDIVDVSPAVAAQMADEGLFSPFIPTNAADLPADLRDAGNDWNSAYFGIIAISTNTTLVPNAPETFADLTKPEYRGKVALMGDPRETGSAFGAVMAAALASGGSVENIKPGIDFFGRLAESGNLVAQPLTVQSVLSGETPIAIDWGYNVPALAKQLDAAGQKTVTHFPVDGIYGGSYMQGLVADAPNPNCGKLWLEHLLSDEGATQFLHGGAIPGRYRQIMADGEAEAQTSALPPEAVVNSASVMSPAQVRRATELLDRYWEETVTAKLDG